MPISYKATTTPQQYEQLFTSSGTWTKPAGVKTCEVKIIGGAGGPISGGSSGAGGYWHGFLDVSDETTIPITVGAAAPTLAIGGASSFGNFIKTFGSPAGTTGGSAVGGVVDRTKTITNPVTAPYQEVFSTQSFAINQRNIKRVGRRIFAIPTSNTTLMTTIVFYDMESNTVVTQNLPGSFYASSTKESNVSYANGVWFITGLSSSSGSSSVNRMLYSQDGTTWNSVTVGAYTSGSQYAPDNASPYYSCVTYVNGNYVLSRPHGSASTSFMYATTPGGTWNTTGTTDTVSHGAIMFYDSTYSVYVAVCNAATSSTSDDEYKIYTSSNIAGTWTLAGNLSISASAGNSPAWQIVKEGSSIYFVSSSSSLTSLQNIYVDQVELTSATGIFATLTTLPIDLFGDSEDVSAWPVPAQTFYKDGYCYIGLPNTGLADTQQIGLKVDVVNGTMIETVYGLPVGEVAEVSPYTYPFMDEPSSTTGYYTWLPNVGGTETISAVIPREYYSGGSTSSGSASPGIGGPSFQTSSATTTTTVGGPGIDGWGIGGTERNFTTHGDLNFGSGANGTTTGTSGAVLVRWVI